MKKLMLILSLVAAVTLSSCKKKIWGCMDETALNYSPVATEDAQDCVYQEQEEVLVSNTLNNIVWENQGSYWLYNITWVEITSDVINNGAVSVFIGDGSGAWVQLPYIIFWSGYFTTVSAEYAAGEVNLIWEDSDGVLPTTPALNSVKLVIYK